MGAAVLTSATFHKLGFDWHLRVWSDGCVQVYQMDRCDDYILERGVIRRSARNPRGWRHWVVVDRSPGDFSNAPFGGRIVGPRIPNLTAALLHFTLTHGGAT